MSTYYVSGTILSLEYRVKIGKALFCGVCITEETGRYREERSKPKWDLCALQTGGTVLHPNLAAYTQIQSIDII